MAKKKTRRIGFVIAAVIALLAIIINIGLGMFASTMDALFATHEVLSETVDKDEAFQNSKTVAKKVQDEGTVLLKNDGLLPLGNKTAKVNLFGWGSYEPVYSGYGSGGMRPGTKMENFTTLRAAFENAGYEVNSELMDAYAAFCEKRVNPGAVTNHNYSIYELPIEQYEGMLANAKAFSNYAIITISRAGGEGDDVPLPGEMSEAHSAHYGVEYGKNETKHYLELSDDEEAMVQLVCENFDNVIVLVNSINAMELGFVDEYDSIKGALWIGGPGTVGFESVADIIKGNVNPSGRLVDTYAYDITSSPAFVNFGYTTFYNDDINTSANKSTLQFANYVEGIYVGYRYYETAAHEGYIDYDSTVQYPFGYGLSYTTFDQTLGEVTEEDGVLTLPVTVTNTGGRAGKEVVQVYVTAPYTPGGIEKSYVSLAGFGKTGIIEPKASEIVEIKIPVEELASYDYKVNGCYVLESGKYELKLMKNSHEMFEGQSYTYSVPAAVIYNENNKRSTDLVAATNRFEDVAIQNATVEDTDTLDLTRADFAGTWPTKDHYATGTVTTVGNKGESINTYKNVYIATATQYVIDNIVTNTLTAEAKTYAEPNSTPLSTPYKWRDFPYYDSSLSHPGDTVTLADMSMVSYDEDETWNKFLGQMNYDELMTMVIFGTGYGSAEIESIQKSVMLDVDGPIGASSYQGGNNFDGCHYPISTTLAATWNRELAEEMGRTFANELTSLGISGIYGPSVNTHRTPFGGRNWEYMSEDPLISGHMAGSEIYGLGENGIYAYLKHYAVNDQDSGRENSGLHTWLNEQALREIYLKPFEIAVKQYGANAIMSSFNRLGPVWTGGRYDLCTEVLRDEWGFEGNVLSDYWYDMTNIGMGGKFYMGVEDGLYAGNDCWLNGMKTKKLEMSFDGSSMSDVEKGLLLRAAKRMCYTFSRGELLVSREQFPIWRILWIVGDVIVFGSLAAFAVVTLRRRKKKAAE